MAASTTLASVRGVCLTILWQINEEPTYLAGRRVVSHKWSYSNTTMGPNSRTLRDDQRAVAPLIAVVLLFGFVTIGFSLYQAEIIPDQNSQTEFQHFQDTQDQMIAIQSAARDTVATSQPRSTTFDLGTEYRTRYFGINPPPPTGRLATSEPYNITINPNGEDVTVEARFLEYEPNYRELETGLIRYEHGLTYLDARETGGDVVFLPNQDAQPVQGNSVQVVPLQNTYEESGQRRVSIQFYRSTSGGELPSSINSINLSTRLSEETWNELIGSANVVNFTGGNPNYVQINRTGIQVTPVGISSRPVTKTTDEVTDTDQQLSETIKVFARVTKVAGNSGKVKKIEFNWTVSNFTERTPIRLQIKDNSNDIVYDYNITETNSESTDTESTGEINVDDGTVIANASGLRQEERTFDGQVEAGDIYKLYNITSSG